MTNIVVLVVSVAWNFPALERSTARGCARDAERIHYSFVVAGANPSADPQRYAAIRTYSERCYALDHVRASCRLLLFSFEPVWLLPRYNGCPNFCHFELQRSPS
jgi:hypothetical protein